MHPRERLLGVAQLYRQRGQPVPLDVLVEAEQLGLSLQIFDEPTHHNANSHEGEIHNGNQEETDF